MNPTSVSLSLLLLATGLAAQTGAAGVALASVRQKFVLVQPVDGQLWGMGADYTSRFLADRVSFAPDLPESPVDPTVRLRARACGRGRDLVPLPAPTAPVADGLVVSYARGAITETYAMRPEAMKQSFVFRELPAGDGDLVVEVQIDTALPLQAIGGQELVFGTDRGAVRIDTVVGIDATGEQVFGSLGYAHGVMTLRLPGDFVQRAALPLVLDPLITSTTTISALVGEGIDAAYDASTGTWFAVWKQRNTPSGTSPFSVRGWLEPGGAVLVDADGTQSDPVVASCNARHAFVVAWTEVDGLYTRAVQTPSVLGGPRRLNANTSLAYDSLGIANNPSPSDDRMLLASRLTSSGVTYTNLFSLPVPPNLQVGAPVSAIVSSSGGVYGAVGPVAIASSGGANGEYLVCWSQQVSGNPILVSRLFGPNGSSLSSEQGTLAPGTDLREIRVDGQDGRWIAAFNSSTSVYPFSSWIYLMGIDRQASGALVQRDAVLVEAAFGGGRLDVALAGTRAVLAFVRVLIPGCTSTSGQCASSRLGSYTLADCLPCQPSEEWQVLPYSVALVRPAASGDASNPELVRAYTSIQTRMTLDNQVGVVTDLGGACGGQPVRARAECAKVGGNHQAVLENSPASSWLVIGTDRADLRGCGTCVLVPNPYTSMVIGPVQRDHANLAKQTFPIPALSSLIGLTFLQQWLVPDPQTPGCASFQFSFSNALRVQIQ